MHHQPTWRELVADIIRHANNLDDPACICIYYRDEVGTIRMRTNMPVDRFSPLETANTGGIIIETRKP